MPDPRRFLVVGLVLALTVAACGGGDDDTEAADTDTTTTSQAAPPDDGEPDEELTPGPPTTRGLPETVNVEPIPDPIPAVTVISGDPAYRGILGQIEPDRYVVQPVALPPADLGPGFAPLTGLATTDSALSDRPALLVKVDNTSKGRPQESLNLADLVYEEQIEGGFTRLAVVFHTNAPLLGPVRSGRTTDIALLGSLGQPIFAWSGANRVHAALLRQHDMVDLGAQSRNEYYRASGRPGTYDLMVEAAELHEIAADDAAGTAPPAHFEYRDDMVTLPEVAEPADHIEVAFPSARSEWDWDGEAWLRIQDGTEHLDASGEQVAAANVIVALVDHVATGSRDLAGSTVYEELFLGQGEAMVFTDGHMVPATWTKASIDSVPTYTTADDVPVPVTPGMTWVVLAPADSASWS